MKATFNMSITIRALIFLTSFLPTLVLAESSRLLIISEHDAQVSIDGEQAGAVIAREPKIFSIFPGEHVLWLRSVDGKYQWSGQVAVAPGLQRIFDKPLRPVDPMTPFIENELNPADEHTYRIVTVNGQTWLGENLRVAKGKNIVEPSGERLYDRASARTVGIMPGWHLPKRAEWERLLATYGSGAREALTPGGASLINLRDSGIFSAPDGKPQRWESPPGKGVACYWMDESGSFTPAVILRPTAIEIGGNFPRYSLCAVRLLRD
ncbi:FISUMP domain-containing protein [Jeongeupia naejangsanensis]|uniref:Fibrobacter succinogenes major paralogous domain-containing protein n=1 Tax=Jeongeupia naejangsanensis TaxID=613195 RepID=A0ABS2BFA7_9NEIS|nr:FISUMP domain-containing protein [Jeongeupia naejangsanensis]MBM3114285.1 hypothetical protein [Jeongeupia naejangsanensis]